MDGLNWKVYRGSFNRDIETCHTNFGDAEMPLASLLASQKIVQGQQVRNFYVLRSDTAVNLISIHVHKQRDYNVTKSRIAVYKQNWSDAIILRNTLSQQLVLKKWRWWIRKRFCVTNIRISSFTAKSCTKTGLARRTKGHFKFGRKTIRRLFL